jgi:hypothetical protein
MNSMCHLAASCTLFAYVGLRFSTAKIKVCQSIDKKLEGL